MNPDLSHEFSRAIIAGIGRCDTEALLREYWERWQANIAVHPSRDEMVQAKDQRKVELAAEVERQRREEMERKRYEPRGKRK